MRTLLIAALAAVVAIAAADAQEYKLGDLQIEHPFARATAEMAKTGAVYLTIRNQGADDRLLSAHADVAAGAMLHQSKMQDGVMHMQHLEKGLPLPAGQTVTLAPGGYHIMLMGLKAPLQEGGRFPLSLSFEKSGEITVDVIVESMTAGLPTHGDYRKEGDHGHGQKMQ